MAVNLSIIDSVALVAVGNRLTGRKGAVRERGALREPTVQQVQELLTNAQNEMLGVNAMHSRGITGQGILVAVFDGGFSNVDLIPSLAQ